jgi:hypothetical protein
MKLTITKTYEFERCWNCPYHEREMGGVMCCAHPEVALAPYIITQDNRQSFPKECPLLAEKNQKIVLDNCQIPV